jgi:hypothetical protein
VPIGACDAAAVGWSIDPAEIIQRRRQFTGTHLHGTLQVGESTVKELLRAAPPPLSGCDVAVAADNRLVVRYGMLQATATIEGFEPGPSPRLRLSLASFLIALGVKAAVRASFVHVTGRQVVIDLGAVPALQPYAPLFPYVRRMDVATAPGRILVDVAISVTE